LGNQPGRGRGRGGAGRGRAAWTTRSLRHVGGERAGRGQVDADLAAGRARGHRDRRRRSTSFEVVGHDRCSWSRCRCLLTSGALELDRQPGRHRPDHDRRVHRLRRRSDLVVHAARPRPPRPAPAPARLVSPNRAFSFCGRARRPPPLVSSRRAPVSRQQARQQRGLFVPHGVERLWIQAQRTQDRRRTCDVATGV